MVGGGVERGRERDAAGRVSEEVARQVHRVMSLVCNLSKRPTLVTPKKRLEADGIFAKQNL